MKVRSKALYAYLLEAGVLNGTPEEIDRAKCAYRLSYKRTWKLNKKPRKEIRIEFTLKQFAVIKAKAIECDIKHTAYARNAILSAAGNGQLFPARDELLKALQLVSMVAIGTIKNTISTLQTVELLEKAEHILLKCIQT